MLTIGMLWLGQDTENAYSYYFKKFGKYPNEMETHPSSELLGGKKSVVFDKFTLLECKSILPKTLFVGCREDKEEIKKEMI